MAATASAPRSGAAATFGPLLSQTKSEAAQLVDLALVLDVTGSMERWLKEACDKMQELMTVATEMVKERKKKVRVAIVLYRDLDKSSSKRWIKVVDFDTDTAAAAKVLNEAKATGGDDACEDVAGALREVAQTLSWKGVYRVLVHVCDAPPHGNVYHKFSAAKNYDNFPNGDPEIPNDKFDDIVRSLADKRIDYTLVQTGKDPTHTDVMRDRFKQLYAEVRQSKGMQFPSGEFSSLTPKDEASKFLNIVMSSISTSTGIPSKYGSTA
eukprot:Opistho-1_new@54842